MSAGDLIPLDEGYQLVKKGTGRSGNQGWWEIQYEEHEFARLPGVLTLEEAYELGRLLAHLHRTRMPPRDTPEPRMYV